MAATKPIAASRPTPGVRRSATPSGVTHVRAYQSSHYTIIGNHLAQHRALSLIAIGLAVHILSLPQGAPVDIRSLAERFPEGRDRISFGLRELEAHGYLERVRERTDGGRFVTRTYAHNVPALTRSGTEAPEVRDVLDVPAARVAQITPVAAVAPAAPVAEVEVDPEDGPVSAAPPPTRSEPPGHGPSEHEPSGSPERCGSEHHDKAVALLAGLRRTDDRFMLSRKDVERLAPVVVAWLDNGASRAAVIHAMTADVPAAVKSPAGLLAYRLREGLPPPLPHLSPSTERAKASPADPGRTPPTPWADPWTDCEGGCTRVFRRSAPDKCCRDCRARRAMALETVLTV
ncbi:helix-turn-helix domain-containing protein [Streptomyces sp. NPDC049687]|uniref:helix-turn-helix domain-containing protein n=1 Tax=Streptomyces sp. NPDC049687 TaxID=3365596 RepID=UPI0037A511DF